MENIGKIKIKYGNDAFWNDYDILNLLEPGKFGYNAQSKVLKLGNGIDKFQDLEPVALPLGGAHSKGH